VISVYADGSSSGGRDKPGGYGWVIVRREEVLAWGYGGSAKTTNNLMELEGARAGLEALLSLGLHETGEQVELVSDSQYTLGLASGVNHASANVQEAGELRQLAVKARVRCRWVRGHNGVHWNEIVDKLAKQGKMENSPEGQKKTKKEQRRERKRRAKECVDQGTVS
jgi:ribonuclease HI